MVGLTVRVFLILSVVALAQFMGGPAGFAVAQDDQAASTEDGAVVSRFAVVAEGACETRTPQARFRISEVDEQAVSDRVPAADALTGAGILDTAVAPLLEAPHAVAVLQEETAGSDSIIACGEITGRVARGALAIGLEEQHDSGYAGVARLSTKDERTVVTLFLTKGLAGTTSDIAISVGDLPPCCQTGPDSAIATVNVVDFAFLLPPVVEMQVGATVTWISQGTSDHAVTIFRNGELVADTETLRPGESFAYTFEEPGSYDYFCTRHPGMKARIDVVP